MQTRKARLADWKATAPTGTIFLGFGGMCREYESAVFVDPDGNEVRFPFRPSAFAKAGKSKGRDAYEEVAIGYACTAFSSWDEWEGGAQA